MESPLRVVQCNFKSCVYSTPGSVIGHFMKIVADILVKVSFKERFFACADFNIDLSFCNMTFRHSGLWPLTDKPRTALHLIDYIFSGVNHRATCALPLNDISDHLPILLILQSVKAKTTAGYCESLKIQRLRATERKEGLRKDCSDCNWDKVHF